MMRTKFFILRTLLNRKTGLRVSLLTPKEQASDKDKANAEAASLKLVSKREVDDAIFETPYADEREAREAANNVYVGRLEMPVGVITRSALAAKAKRAANG